MRNPALRPVDSTYSYLRTVLRNGGVEPAALAAAPPPAVMPPAEPATAAPSDAGLAAEAQVQARLAQRRAELQAMAPPLRQAYVDQAIARLIDKGLYTPVIRRRAEQGDPLHGALGAMVVQVYAEAMGDPPVRSAPPGGGDDRALDAVPA